MDNTHIERFNGRFREEYLNQHVFRNLLDARQKIEVWCLDCNATWPHSALGYMTLVEFREKHRPQPVQVANLWLGHQAGEHQLVIQSSIYSQIM